MSIEKPYYIGDINLEPSNKSIPDQAYRNVFVFDDLIQGGFGLVNQIIGAATGQTAAQIEAQKQAAAAALAQAEAEKARANRKNYIVPVVAITGVTLMFITGFALYFKYRKKGAATGK